VIAGKPFTYTVFVETGLLAGHQRDATDTMVSDGLFTGAWLQQRPPRHLSARPTPTRQADEPLQLRVCAASVGAKAAAGPPGDGGGQRHMDVNNNARVWMARPYVDPKPGHNTDSASIHVVDTADLVIESVSTRPRWCRAPR